MRLEELSTETLLQLLSDMAHMDIMKNPSKDTRFLFWYGIYKEIQKELDQRIKQAY